MNRFILMVLALSIPLSGCLSNPPEIATRTDSPPMPASTAQATPTLDSADVLAPLSLHTGYGVASRWLGLYFTNPANPASSQRSGGPDEPLVATIDAARLSVDAAMYSLSLNSVRDALLRAWRRGIQVRVVMESDNLDRPDPEALKDAGVPVLGDRREGLMHDKFIVIDRAEVWTGSMNFTDSGAYSDNNCLLRIRSQLVAEDYEAEFDEMFIDDQFGAGVGRPTPNPRVTVGSTLLDVYFSPDDEVESALVGVLDGARSSIYFLAYSFTSDALGEAIRRQAAAGVKVAGVMDADQATSNLGGEYDAFRSAGLAVRLDGNPGQMHHKLMIIDGEVVIVGSYNFTRSAQTANDENLIVIHDPAIAAQFTLEFARVYALAEH